MRRREKFIISAILLSLGLLAVQYINLQYRFLGVFVLFVLSYIITAWALYDDLHGVEWITIIPFPSFYALAVSLFYFLLPENFITRIFILALFGVGMYALYLTANIYSVAKARTIQLLRAAHTIGLLFTLLISALLSNTIFSLHLPFWQNGLLLGIIHFPLIFMSLWAIKLQSDIDRRIVSYSLFSAFLIGELGVALSFFPISVWTASLLITSLMYVLLGLLVNLFQERMFRNTIWEYLIFAGFVFFSFLFLLEWK